MNNTTSGWCGNYAPYEGEKFNPRTYWLHLVCWRFGTLCLFHLHRPIGMKNDWGWECWGIYRKRFGLKIAWANRKEGDMVGAGPSRETGCGGQWPTWRLRVRMWRRYGACRGERWDSRGQTFSCKNTPTFSTPVILHTYPLMRMEQSVSKRRHIKFRRRGITQKKAYNIQNMAKVWN